MKIAISSDGKNLEASIDPRFGRCRCFLIVETDDMSFEAFDNENVALSGGAGIQSAQFERKKRNKGGFNGKAYLCNSGIRRAAMLSFRTL